jgi:hypothetical protein
MLRAEDEEDVPLKPEWAQYLPAEVTQNTKIRNAGHKSENKNKKRQNESSPFEPGRSIAGGAISWTREMAALTKCTTDPFRRGLGQTALALVGGHKERTKPQVRSLVRGAV